MAIGRTNAGGKPEEEKTVTAGTSAVTVDPTKGKTMKRVTVNPTPSQAKTVTAGTNDVTVNPDNGKLLSQVTVAPTPSQTKTVTAETGNVTVLPDSGKLLSKVTVAPTPTQSKSVTPSTSQQTVTPDAGKHLSSVVVEAVEDVTPEVTAQSGLIESIAKEFDVSITTPSGTNKKKLQTNNENLSKIKNGASTSVINGILEEYYAESGTIDANTFVDFVDSVKNTFWSQLSSSRDYPFGIQAVKLNDSQVLLVFMSITLFNAGILTFTNKDVSIGTITRLQNGGTGSAARKFDLSYLKISDTEFYFLGRSGSYVTPRSGLVGFWVTVDNKNREVSVETRTTVDSTEYSANLVSNAISLGSNRFLLLTSRGSVGGKYPLFYNILKADPTTKTVSLEKQAELYSANDYAIISGGYSQLLQLTKTKYCFLTGGSQYNLCVFDFINDSVSNVTFTTIVASSTSFINYGSARIHKLSDSKIILVRPNGPSNPLYFDAHFITISSNNTATLNQTLTNFVSFDTNCNYGFLTLNYKNNKFYMYPTGGESYNYAYKAIFSINISNNTLTLDSKEQIYDGSSSADGRVDVSSTSYQTELRPCLVLELSDNSNLILSTRDNSSYVYTAFKTIRKRISAVKSAGLINGLTKNKISETASGKVWVLKGE